MDEGLWASGKRTNGQKSINNNFIYEIVAIICGVYYMFGVFKDKHFLKDRMSTNRAGQSVQTHLISRRTKLAKIDRLAYKSEREK